MKEKFLSSLLDCRSKFSVEIISIRMQEDLNLFLPGEVHKLSQSLGLQNVA